MNDTQDETTDWEPVSDVWAAVDPNFSQEANEANRELLTVLIAVTIRYRRDVDARWRIQDAEHVYEIKGMQDISRRRSQLRLSCQEVI